MKLTILYTGSRDSSSVLKYGATMALANAELLYSIDNPDALINLIERQLKKLGFHSITIVQVTSLHDDQVDPLDYESPAGLACLHTDIEELDSTCIHCKNCGAISYNRDSGGEGQPKERVWRK